MSETDKVVDCRHHGLQGPAYVCQHLDLEIPRGFVEGFDPDDVESELHQAWCRECDVVLMAEGDWNDVSEGFAKPRLICRACYLQIKRLNRGSPS